MNLDDSPEEPHYISELSALSPASPKPLHFPAPTNIPVLNNMMDVEYNQTELHMQNPAMRNTEVRDGAWKEDDAGAQSLGESSGNAVPESGPAQLSLQEGEQSVEAETEPAQSLAEHDLPLDDMTNNATYVESLAPAVQNMPTEDLDPSLQPASAPSAEPQGEFPRPEQAAQSTVHDPAASALVTDADAFLSQLQTAAHPYPPDAQSLPSNIQPDVNVSVEPSQTVESTAGVAASDGPWDTHDAVDSFTALDQNNNTLAQSSLPTPSDTTGNVTANPTPALSLASLFPSGTLPADLAASLMHGASLPFSVNTQLPTQTPVPAIDSRVELPVAVSETRNPDEEKWDADIQHKYDDFILDERRYVNEGRWDSFPTGSRLFVGNLSSEVVTKRDIFHVFHSYGKLAQISIKQAFGFVQFLTTEDCMRALDGEQGRPVKGKKIHLEISKPQKSRNQANNRDRRSRSPEHRDSGRGDRYTGSGRSDRNRGFRSPSPRGGYRDRFDDRRRNRSRSPGLRDRRYGRSPSPRRSDMDDDLPLPRRAPQDVPEVQVIVIDNLDREFIGWVEKAFASRGIRVAVLLLSPRLDEQAVVKRQILEGVLAVSKLTRLSQGTGKIDLQIFDRRAGQSNVRFEEYSNLDPSTCAELVLRARSTHAAPPPPVQYGYSQQPSFIPPAAPPPQYGYGQPPATPQYNAAPPYAAPNAGPPQYAYPQSTPYGTLKPVQQSSVPPQMLQGGYPSYGPPQTMQPVSFPGNPSNMQPVMPQQPPMPPHSINQQGAPQSAPVDMQQILARLGTYNK